MKISDLKVADLKSELEKRGIDKTGTKSRLIEKLKNALEEEGIDADEHEFDLDSSAKTANTNSKRKADSAPNAEGEEEEMDASSDNPSLSQKFVNLADDDEDTPCSDEEMDDYSKNKDDTESARFRTAAQTRADAAAKDEAEDEAKDEAEKETSSEDKPNDASEEPSKNKEENEAEAPSSEADANGPDSKTNKGKVLKVIGKDKVQQVALTARTLWVTGLASTSKVSDLKNLFSKHGKVTSAKIVRSTKGTQRKWYGLLTMATSKDASTCIQKLHRTELGGHVISVERRQTAPIVKKSEASVVKKQVSKSDVKESAGSKSVAEAKKGENEDEKRKEGGDKDKEDEEGKGSSDRRKSHESKYIRGRYSGSRGSFRRPFGFRGGRGGFRGSRGRGMGGGFRRPFGRSHFERPGVGYRSSYSSRGFGYESYRSRGSPREERYERDMRIDRDEEMYRHKLIVRKQREEAYRLEREKNQLRMEREMLEREKAEMLKLEKAKQRMEREQLEVEREKLRRQAQMSHGPSKRPFARRGGGPPVWADKRREAAFDGGPSGGFHREKFAYGREFKKDFPPEEFHREKMDGPPSHSKFIPRDERREVTYHGAPDRRVYSREEFRSPHPGPSSSPPMKHFSRSKPREEWKFHERRASGEKPYPARGHKRMGFY